MFSYQIGDHYAITELKNKIEKNKKFDQKDVDFFLQCIDYMEKRIEDKLEYQIKTLKEAISRNIGNQDILTRMKEELSNSNELNNQDFRYLQFCINELERQKIFEDGVVPMGWLPSDKNDDFAKLNELWDQVSKNKKYIKWGIAAAGHDVLTKGKIDL